ncbi:F-box DNA helicase 1 isoform X2 [Dunckerocampus dactyliophorus]|uniref:F-box DNA helicase 1 isoform X2 n=1 Tax=Dunckerocampus dactyliophorus TaxID=161453 RepID=UPI0024075A22|nr:F-box DNA helicase 1 isoform X2 [Dunckerocampus dactyliophorus]
MVHIYGHTCYKHTHGSMEVAVKGRAKRRHLNADELERNAEGLQALIHPQNTNTRRSDYSLHPRTTAKRRKAGIYTNGLNREQLSEDMSTIDDEEWSPPAAEIPSDSEEKQSDAKELDHLEGITAEMFEDDFDCSDGIMLEEPAVEALPDVTYGLLGCSRALQQPQGCIDNLPEEVLRQIFTLLPAQDLYRSAMLVCARWCNIIEDPKFMPYKKSYYRYMMEEDATVLEVSASLRNCGILTSAMSPHGIRNLVISMAHHTFGERVNPTEVLQCVEKHRLFPHAEASIRLRICNVPKCKMFETEGPNPYAAMAVILLLSESVGDVLSLVSLLSGCMSHMAITEYLSHMATLLLAARRNNVKISERLHYNIYYVLHLRENGPFSIRTSEGRDSGMNMTSEQLHILSHDIQKDHMVKIVAFAGTGKTTTLIKYAELRPELRFLYVAFNKSVASEASERFPNNVDCKTVHSLAYRDIGILYKKKLTFNLNAFTINTVLPEGRGGFAKAKVVVTTLNNFMASKDQTITVDHVPDKHVSLRGLERCLNGVEKGLVVQDAQTIWIKMKDVNETNKSYKMTHDGYLKLWQLQTPPPHLYGYHVLLIDEAQDCTPSIIDVLLKQQCGKILVGDPHQQIYTFRGAVNALQTLAHTHIYYLTQSFRFGAEIAYVGATILTVCKKVRKILVGGRQEGGVFDEKAAQAARDVASGKTPGKGKTAILSRCNQTIFSEAVRLTDANTECRIHFVGGVDNIGLDKIKDIWYLMEGSGNRRLIKDHLIRTFSNFASNSFAALKNFARNTADHELESKLNIVERYQRRIPELVMRLKRHSEENANKADFILGTVHRAKGLEFDIVVVSDDFADIPAPYHYIHCFADFSFDKIVSDEWNLLYVAVTRAKTTLIITKKIMRIITMANEYFLKSEMPSAPLKVDNTPQCTISNCPNYITPGAAFMMCKRQLAFTGSVVSSGGELCERCVWTRVGPVAFLMTDDVCSMAEAPVIFPPPPHSIQLFFQEAF